MDATPGKSGRHPELLGREDTLLLVVDLQQRLMPAIAEGQRVIDNVCRLVAGARVLGLPVIATEQYPRGLGSTVPAVAELLEESPRAEKLSFSCLGDTAPREQIAAAGKRTLLVCGAEAHVCVLQTVLDALAAGYRVQVAADAVGSRDPSNRETALRRMERAGAVLTCTESALFELLVRAGSEEFRQISALVK